MCNVSYVQKYSRVNDVASKGETVCLYNKLLPSWKLIFTMKRVDKKWTTMKRNIWLDSVGFQCNILDRIFVYVAPDRIYLINS